MKKRKILSALLSFCMLLGVLLITAQPVNAAVENNNVLEARKGIVQVMYAGQNKDKEYVNLYGGTGFLIGTEEEGAQYVITNHHVVYPLDEAYFETQEQYEAEEAAVWDYLNLSSSDKEFKVKIRIVLKRDSYVDAEIIQDSLAADFAILKLEKPIYGDRKPLTLVDSDTVQPTSDVYALGFPAIVQAMQDDQLFTSSDVTITKGTVSKVAESVLINSPIPCINHSATITSGNSGGPLVDANGNVVGVNRHTDGSGTYFYSVQIKEISELLDMEGIDYMKADAAVTDGGSEDTPEVVTTEEPTPEPTEAPAADNSALFDELGSVIKKAEDQELEKMTEESAANLDDALSAAKKVYNNTGSTEEELKSAISDLEDAVNGLVEAPKGLSPVLIIAIAAAVIIVIIVIVVLVVVSGNKKKKQEAERERQRRAAMNGMGAAPKPPVTPVAPGPQPGGPAGQWNQRPVNPMMGSDGSEETGVLNDGSSETTVLGGQNIPTAYLIRKKNNERITISKAIFKIGKERRKVDYCISDNTNISRTHADLVYRNGEFYIVDNNATNGTSVNGSSVAAGQERKVMNNDVIKLADEEFQFRTF